VHLLGAEATLSVFVCCEFAVFNRQFSGSTSGRFGRYGSNRFRSRSNS
jgi:hypothetical protein